MPVETVIANANSLKISNPDELNKFLSERAEKRDYDPLMFVDIDGDLFVSCRHGDIGQYRLFHVDDRMLYANYPVSYPVHLAPEGSLVIIRQPKVDAAD